MPRGGKRNGAGRKKTQLARSGKKINRTTAEEILAAVDEKESWLGLLCATHTASVAVISDNDGKEIGREPQTFPDNKIRLEAMKYLTDRRDGKAPLAIQHTAQVVVQFRRDPATPAIQVATQPKI